jgi:hypothetical protein
MLNERGQSQAVQPLFYLIVVSPCLLSRHCCAPLFCFTPLLCPLFVFTSLLCPPVAMKCEWNTPKCVQIEMGPSQLAIIYAPVARHDTVASFAIDPASGGLTAVAHTVATNTILARPCTCILPS